MSQKLKAYEFKCIGSNCFTEHLIRYYNDIGTVGYTHEVDIKYLEELGMVHRELLFLPEKMKLICNLKETEEYVVHLRKFKQTPDNGLKLEKAHGKIEFNQKD